MATESLTKLERIAAAMVKANHRNRSGIVFEDMGVAQRNRYRAMAEAALEALRPVRSEDFTQTEWRAIHGWIDETLGRP